MYRITVPATSANMGPGFDAIGIALTLYNELEVFEAESPLFFTWEDPADVLSPEDNLIYTSMLDVFQEYDFPLPFIEIVVKKTNIPIRRGLGSSSAAIVAGLTLAYALMGHDFDRDMLCKKACDIEGHPDNVVPAVLGGMTVTVITPEAPLTSRITVPSELAFIAVIPPYEVSTEESRAALPNNYQRSDCIGNASRTALLVSIMYNKKFEYLRTAFEDFVHQPFRLPLMKDQGMIFSNMQEQGSLGEFISGSGSTLMGVFLKEDANQAYLAIKKALEAVDPLFRTELLDVDYKGIQLEEI